MGSHTSQRGLRRLGSLILPVIGCVLAVIIWTGPLSATGSGLADEGEEEQTEPAVKVPELAAPTTGEAAQTEVAEAKTAAEKAVEVQAPKDKAAKDKAAKDKAARDKAAREKAEKEKATNDKAAEAGSETLGRSGREHIAISCFIILFVLTYVTVYAFLKSGIRRTERARVTNNTPKPRWRRLVSHGIILIGLLMLVFSAWWLTSPLEASSDDANWWPAPRESWFASITLPEVTLLIVATFGSLGGVLFTMLDNKLTLPSYDPDAREIKLGYLVDCAYGWGGAFAAFLVIPGNLTINDNLMKVIGTAIVAGYGGRAVMEKSLGKILARVNEVEGKFAKEDAAQTLAREQIEGKVVPKDELEKAIDESSPLSRSQIFSEVEQVLKDYAGVAPDRVGRTLPVLAALAESDKNDNHRYHATLGLALLKGKDPPDYKAAMESFNTAIEIRNKENAGPNGTYELGRAVCRITTAPDEVESIKGDLKTAAADKVIKQRYEQEKSATAEAKKDVEIQLVDKWLEEHDLSAQKVGLEPLTP